MKKPKAKKAGQREAALIARLRSDEVLCAERSNELEAQRFGGMRYWFEPSLKSCGPATAHRAITSGLLMPISSALFAGIVGQCYALGPGK